MFWCAHVWQLCFIPRVRTYARTYGRCEASCTRVGMHVRSATGLQRKAMSQVAPVGSETQFFCRAECTVAALFGFMGALFGSATFPARMRMGSQKNEVGKVASGDQPGGWVVQPDELGRAPRYVRTYVRIATRRSFPSRGGYVRT